MIEIADTAEKIHDCFPVMVQLRQHLDPDSFIEQVLQQTIHNYRLVYLKDNEKIVAVAGFRLSHCLAWGDFLYIDDLITDELERSKGYGKQLLDWLVAHAKENDCGQLHLDSGVQRKDAHRFYEREGMLKTGFHFALPL